MGETRAIRRDSVMIDVPPSETDRPLAMIAGETVQLYAPADAEADAKRSTT